MKIIDIEINELRGIKNLKLKFNEKNSVIYGDNGSGKSGVIDAIDFLISGNISRLKGQGTGSLSLVEHGKHVTSADINNSWVSATIKINSRKTKIKRKLSSPKDLECDEEYKEELEKIVNIAQMQPHFLSRREILKYINSSDGDRAKEIEKILNFNLLENNRNILQKLMKEYKKNYDIVKNSKIVLESNISMKLQNPQDKWLESINEKRSFLGATDISDLSYDVLESINLSSKEKTVSNLARDLEIINEIKSSLYDNGLKTQIELLIRCLKQLIKIENIKEKVNKSNLYSVGLEVLTDDKCPLCSQPIDEEHFRQHLIDEISSLNLAKELSDNKKIYIDQIKKHCSEVLFKYNKITETSKHIINTNDFLFMINQLTALNLEVDNITIVDLEDFFKNFMLVEEIDKIIELLTKTSVEKSLDNNETKYKELLDFKSEYKLYSEKTQEFSNLEKNLIRAETLYKEYETAQNIYLNEIYDSIQDRFSELYIIMHGDDESTFKGILERSKGSLKMNVTFKDNNNYPPNAVHSEGHQDSMGICLFLALSEKISTNIIDLVLLDDVVMSIDHDHRNQFCKILKTIYPHKQFIITTHDFIWRKELESQQVVSTDSIYHFRAWDLENGPYVAKFKDAWDDISIYLNLGKKEESIAQLRYYLEEFFSYKCAQYRLPVPYSNSARWTLSDLITPVHVFFKSAFKSTIESADSFKKDNGKQKLLYSEYTSLFSSLRSNEWALNPNVHFTPWAKNLSISELSELVSNFKKFTEIFNCKSCKSEIFINYSGNTLNSTSCSCGENNFSCSIKK